MSAASGRVSRVSLFRRTVADLGRSIDFYCNALGFSCDRSDAVNDPQQHDFAAAEAPARTACLQLGDEAIELVAPIGFERHPGPANGGEPVFDTAFQHIAIVTGDMDSALARLQRFSPQPISRGGAVTLPPNTGRVTAYKFRDPDGLALELIQFPAGIGDPRWQRGRDGAPTLGIDHGALAVADAERSRDFYVRVLGFEVVSRQINRGAEQARLDGTSEAVVVDVVGLASVAAPTPHVELLGYRQPAPQQRSRASSILDDHGDRLTLVVDDLAAILARLEVDPTLAGERVALGADAVLLRDPDGHLLLLRQDRA